MRGIKALLWRPIRRALKELGTSFFSSQRKSTVQPLYLRGLAINAKYIFTGFSPATIVRIDKKTGKLVDYSFHSTDARVCIHGLECSPLDTPGDDYPKQ
ncbi:MAG: hypothetical protein IMF09_02020 [Proteobacteria bacterium]|nr:hypothetical protein [Pseudomonadota bacterium]